MKRIILIATIFLLILVPANSFALNFTDTEGHWAEKEIDWAYKKGYIKGYPGGEFKSNKNVTRAELYEMVKNLLKDGAKASTEFKDVRDTDWFKDSLDLAKGGGYLVHKDDYFFPNTPSTRLEVVRILNKIYRLDEKSTDNFKDTYNLSVEDKRNIYALKALGIIEGYEDATFRPENSLTRAQICTILKRAVTNLGYSKGGENLEGIKKELEDKIFEAESIDTSKFSKASVENLRYEIKNAKAVLLNSRDKFEISTAISNLNRQMSLLVREEKRETLEIEVRNEIGQVLNAKVYVDGTVYEGGPLAPGKHLVKAEAEGYVSESTFFYYEGGYKKVNIVLKREESSLLRLSLAPTLTSPDEGMVKSGTRVTVTAMPPQNKKLKYFIVNGKIKMTTQNKLILIIKEDTTVGVEYE